MRYAAHDGMKAVFFATAQAAAAALPGRPILDTTTGKVSLDGGATWAVNDRKREGG